MSDLIRFAQGLPRRPPTPSPHSSVRSTCRFEACLKARCWWRALGCSMRSVISSSRCRRPIGGRGAVSAVSVNVAIRRRYVRGLRDGERNSKRLNAHATRGVALSAVSRSFDQTLTSVDVTLVFPSSNAPLCELSVTCKERTSGSRADCCQISLRQAPYCKARNNTWRTDLRLNPVRSARLHARGRTTCDVKCA